MLHVDNYDMKCYCIYSTTLVLFGTIVTKIEKEIIMTKQYRLPTAAIMFTVAAVIRLLMLTRLWTGIWGVFAGSSVLTLLITVAWCVVLYRRKPDIAFIALFAVETLLCLVNLRPGMQSNIYLLSNFLDLLAFAFLLFSSLAFCKQSIVKVDLKKYAPVCKKLFFIPTVLFALAFIMSAVYRVHWDFQHESFYYITISEWLSRQFRNVIIGGLDQILIGFAWISVVKWLSDPPYKEVPEVSDSNHFSGTAGVAHEAYCSLGKHVLLLLFTCGIWLYIWIYRITGYLNCVKDEEPRKPTNKLLLCLFVPFYSIYWTYKSAQRIDKLAAQKGLSSDMSTLCLILAIFVPIIPPILMQDKINNILTTKEAAHTPKEDAPNTTEELKQYKELLDTGVITQEEYDAKKKQLLGL